MSRMTLAERVSRRTQRTSACWLWMGAADPEGYGIIKVAGRARRLTRVAWEMAHGPIPADLLVLHSCDNPPCIRPDHLMLGTQRANIRDMLAKGRRPRRRVAA